MKEKTPLFRPSFCFLFTHTLTCILVVLGQHAVITPTKVEQSGLITEKKKIFQSVSHTELFHVPGKQYAIDWPYRRALYRRFVLDEYLIMYFSCHFMSQTDIPTTGMFFHCYFCLLFLYLSRFAARDSAVLSSRKACPAFRRATMSGTTYHLPVSFSFSKKRPP